MTDPGTGLLNRRGFFEAAMHIRSRDGLCPGHAQWFVLMIDIDHFKMINDRYGHAFGDAVIRSMGAALLDTMPASSICGRLGGEEFAVLTVADSAGRVLALAESVREKFASRSSMLIDGGFRASCSVGASAASSRPRRRQAPESWLAWPVRARQRVGSRG